MFGVTNAVMFDANDAPLRILVVAYEIEVGCFETINVRVADTDEVLKLLGVFGVKTALIVYEPLLSWVFENTSIPFIK